MVKNNLPARDLFGEVIPPVPATRKDGRMRKIGYAGKLATGPKGQRCGTCIHAQRIVHDGEFTHKCDLMVHLWRHTAHTDINLRAPACQKWERKPYEVKK